MVREYGGRRSQRTYRPHRLYKEADARWQNSGSGVTDPGDADVCFLSSLLTIHLAIRSLPHLPSGSNKRYAPHCILILTTLEPFHPTVHLAWSSVQNSSKHTYTRPLFQWRRWGLDGTLLLEMGVLLTSSAFLSTSPLPHTLPLCPLRHSERH